MSRKFLLSLTKLGSESGCWYPELGNLPQAWGRCGSGFTSAMLHPQRLCLRLIGLPSFLEAGESLG